eukprot:TRINITY_DN6211_c0_g2_i1.p1 TRINITY_DN6211_c0_g2~~TRINITY_DN6211_c0_g2_i1.p1  ORF type:complete len:329 (-),score=51.53 TRINITY_DN6211_c0_g2_i1:80-1066(-)
MRSLRRNPRSVKLLVFFALALLGYFFLSLSRVEVNSRDLLEGNILTPEQKRQLVQNAVSADVKVGKKKTLDRVKPTESVEKEEQIIETKSDTTTAQEMKSNKCYSVNRNLSEQPISISGWFNGPLKFECDIPCVGNTGGFDAIKSFGKNPEGCPFTYYTTMENVPYSSSEFDIMGTTSLKSDLPLPYMSWAEYNFMAPTKEKNAEALVAAFVTNCGPQDRLKYMRELQAHGVSVHSYGTCDHNRDLPERRSEDWLAQKNEITSHYKFTFSFENSEAEDYVTEKLFGPYSAGSVPLYLGAPNARDFEVSNKSVSTPQILLVLKKWRSIY